MELNKNHLIQRGKISIGLKGYIRSFVSKAQTI